MNSDKSSVDQNHSRPKATKSEIHMHRSRLALSAILAGMLLLATKAAHADTLYSDYSGDGVNPAGVSDSIDIDLNSYDVSTIDDLNVSTQAQGGPRNSDSWSEISGVATAYSDNSANVEADVDASNITQDEDGDWIAETVYSTESGYTYSVDCGSGELELDSYADADSGGWASTDASIGY